MRLLDIHVGSNEGYMLITRLEKAKMMLLVNTDVESVTDRDGL